MTKEEAIYKELNKKGIEIICISDYMGGYDCIVNTYEHDKRLIKKIRGTDEGNRN